MMPKTIQSEIEAALESLGLPKLISQEDIKKQYRYLAKKEHPDQGGEARKMEELNHAYNILMTYVKQFRYTFDDAEISRQYPGANHAERFRP